MPYSESAVFRPGENDRQLWMKGYCGDVVGVALQRLNAGFVLVIPNLDLAVVRARDQVRLVAAGVVVNAVHALLVTLQGEVRG